ncbi:metalloregulator ArsR/SmtB family transcription factor [Cytobacillus horneckiae]|uniref:Transcriptional regulator n=1 Tax=Cytobacillus horneckiae TaxID=549687 RepID=A0A2N0ZHS5_9BACI|nr:metalloregulator ArsR/SmtB family transcription factor [Cytobacillus horneckiae]MCM3177575.1 transcriptional regulator [Cytobacillus horneckiae]MEC1157878.1 transcriptional regulator [Cytobacillus horneckiae]MED2937197.1 transcriptional regulator [Cytobacillus horneckiae]PKG29069.1 transcriptional regulator [Cytobacillus horneckiae]
MEVQNSSTKDKVLHLLKKETSMTVNDLKDRLNITHMAVRKHLTVLENNGFVCSRENKQALGRPTQIYYLTEKGEKFFPKNYEGLSLEFLHDINELYGSTAIEQLFKKREQRLTEEYSKRMDHKTNEEKISELVSIQNEKGYMATAMKTADSSYELTEYNCPILAVAHSYKTACHCETQLLKTVLETEKIKRVNCKTDGNEHCKFQIHFN